MSSPEDSTNPFPCILVSCGWPLDSGEYRFVGVIMILMGDELRSDQVTCTGGTTMLLRRTLPLKARRSKQPQSNSATGRRSPSLRVNDTTTRGAATKTGRRYECTVAGYTAISGRRGYEARATVQAKSAFMTSGERFRKKANKLLVWRGSGDFDFELTMWNGRLQDEHLETA